LSEENQTSPVKAQISLGYERKKIEFVEELNPSKYRPCEIKILKRGVLKKTEIHVHFDGSGWHVLVIGAGGIISFYASAGKEKETHYIT